MDSWCPLYHGRCQEAPSVLNCFSRCGLPLWFSLSLCFTGNVDVESHKRRLIKLGYSSSIQGFQANASDMRFIESEGIVHWSAINCQTKKSKVYKYKCVGRAWWPESYCAGAIDTCSTDLGAGWSAQLGPAYCQGRMREKEKNICHTHFTTEK